MEGMQKAIDEIDAVKDDEVNDEAGDNVDEVHGILDQRSKLLMCLTMAMKLM